MVVLRKLKKKSSRKVRTNNKKTCRKKKCDKKTSYKTTRRRKVKQKTHLYRGGGIIPAYMVDIPINNKTTYTNVPIINVQSIRDHAIRNALK